MKNQCKKCMQGEGFEHISIYKKEEKIEREFLCATDIAPVCNLVSGTGVETVQTAAG